MTADDIIRFWFEEIAPEQWWTRDAVFDRMIIERFGATHARAARCELHAWRAEPQGRLAEVLVLDQFSRNMYRDSAQAFANDALALALAQEAIAGAADTQLAQQQRTFLYLPFMHSESLAIHDIAVDLFERNAIANNLDFELRHKHIIERFGRYPHRNAVLGRASTAAEIEFLREPGSSF
jgi:uncharacterized protein (DUF924 family)